MSLDNRPIDIMSLLPKIETPEAAAEKVKKEQELLETWQVYLKQAIGQKLADLADAKPKTVQEIINDLGREFVDAGKKVDGEPKPVAGWEAMREDLALYGREFDSPASKMFLANFKRELGRVFDNLENLKNDWRDVGLLKHEAAAAQRNFDGLVAIIKTRFDELTTKPTKLRPAA